MQSRDGNSVSIPSPALTFFRFIVGPIVWRLLLIALAILVCVNFPSLDPYKLLASPSTKNEIVDLSPMFYAISSVLGIIAGFLVASLSVVGLGSTQAADRMRRLGRRSLPLKLLYAVICLFLTALAIAFVGPFADRAWAFGLLTGAVLVALIELGVVAFLVFIALRPVTPTVSKRGSLLDP